MESKNSASARKPSASTKAQPKTLSNTQPRNGLRIYKNDRLNEIDKYFTYNEFENKYNNLTESERHAETDAIICAISNPNPAPTINSLQALENNIKKLYKIDNDPFSTRASFNTISQLPLKMNRAVYLYLVAAIGFVALGWGITIYYSIFLP